AMSVFGGHGVMEDFSSLPRLYRDAAINELWEGPRNVLLTQMHRDFQRVSSWYKPSEFVRNILGRTDEGTVTKLGAEMEELIAYPNLFGMDDTTIEVCRRWDAFCHDLFHAYQDSSLRDVEKE
ncbi:MAG TPA: acyl-CoA dehydrogenase family protein, partial [Bacteroidales bacterium]|nr:acyl-CoA dehydrogenase family protein [Bacteroidales bacterium]